MAEQHPAVTHLLAAHERAERLAHASAGGSWVVAERAACDCCDAVRSETGSLVTDADLDDAPLIAEHANPTAVLLRVARERDILAEHQPGSMTEERDETECRTCSGPTPGFSGSWPMDWPCRTVLGLAKAWGWEEAA